MNIPSLSLNKSQLFFMEATTKSEPSVVQVTVRTGDKPSVGILSQYFLSQLEVSNVIAEVLMMHREQSLPPKMIFIGDCYRLIAERKLWKLGLKWKFKWGNENIEPAEEKWQFTFQLIPDNCV